MTVKQVINRYLARGESYFRIAKIISIYYGIPLNQAKDLIEIYSYLPM
jgi:hypothetical protein